MCLITGMFRTFKIKIQTHAPLNFIATMWSKCPPQSRENYGILKIME